MAERQPVESVVRLPVKVLAAASASAIAGWSGDRLRVRITAVAERGKANAALIELIAKTLGLPKSAVRITAGAASARKTLEIAGLPRRVVFARLGEPDEK